MRIFSTFLVFQGEGASAPSCPPCGHPCLTLNEDKCVYAVNFVKLLGYQISNGILQPDTDRVTPTLELPAPTNSKELQRIVGIFSYYARWLPKFI